MRAIALKGGYVVSCLQVEVYDGYSVENVSGISGADMLRIRGDLSCTHA